MSKLNEDVLHLIFEKLQYHKRTHLFSCLLVNKTWCNIIIPILWKNPWKFLKKGKEMILLNVIISHLPQRFEYLKKPYKKPSFDYISCCSYYNLIEINNLIKIFGEKNKKKNIFIIRNEILRLFNNGNTKFTHLYIRSKFVYKDDLVWLSKTCKSIKELEIIIIENSSLDDSYWIVELIKSQKKLVSVHFNFNRDLRPYNFDYKIIEILKDSLNKHVDTIQYFQITYDHYFRITNCNFLSLPFLQVLIASHSLRSFQSSKDLINLIENTNGYLTEIKLEFNDKYIIQAIYQNCPKLKYLKLLFNNSFVSELENLLINCQYLDGLFINFGSKINWSYFFKILVNLSPISLFKFKFGYNNISLKLGPLKYFFVNWKDRHPILLQIIQQVKNANIDNLIEKYKSKGIIVKYDDNFGSTFEDFEWIEDL
ncbi:hypothetical protein C1645_832460 [Glomus cerebriforme]|uniref:F-box domain-containing protein n=1 Tax=Glomus cerebriforme TaxID=658196 RepID=A0A397SN86_9GLOM|nr:hypothetical protein C1645_832460 [Glomus cerebriforme]